MSMSPMRIHPIIEHLQMFLRFLRFDLRQDLLHFQNFKSNPLIFRFLQKINSIFLMDFHFQFICFINLLCYLFTQYLKFLNMKFIEVYYLEFGYCFIYLIKKIIINFTLN